MKTDIFNKIPQDILEICQTFRVKGFQIYLVGGCVRDLLLKRPVEDYDLATDAYPEQSEALFVNAETRGKEFGTIAVPRKNKPGHLVEITTFRLETEYKAARYPKKIIFVSDLKEDLTRRDFTINALAYDPDKKVLIDLFDGQKDLGKKIIRTIGDPKRRFSEDSLRILRAVRFASQLGFEIEKTSFAVIKEIGPNFKLPSRKRIKQEINKILKSDEPKKGWDFLAKAGILDRIMLKCGLDKNEIKIRIP
jgi:tRNA nucleotidyltransferase (CCA-adding enzyme)